MRTIDTIIAAGWIIFWAYWLVMAVTAKSGHRQWTQFARTWIAIILVTVLMARFHIIRDHGAATDNPWLLGTGLTIFVLGLALAVWARVYLGGNWGMPMSQRAEHDLVTTGPYRTIRHPIYSGMLLGIVGTAIAINLYWLNAVAIIGVYFLISAVIEERTMIRLFPAAYPTYRHGTKMLIPHIL
jgi:protein-S-isoprenylcysteine O-methyltransferase Ste14